MLTLVEELLLLALDDESGRLPLLPEYALELAIGGAALMDLSLRDRIDSDLENLQILDTSPTGEPVLDRVLELMAQPGASLEIRACLWNLAERPELRERGLDRLVERGVLRREERKLLWVFGTRRYPKVGGEEHQEVKTRVLQTLQGAGIPEPRDAILIGLLHSCSLLPALFELKEVQQAWHRVEQVARLDMLGRQVLETLGKLYTGVHRGR